MSVLVVLVIIVGSLFAVRNADSCNSNPAIQRLTSVFSLKSALGPRITIWHMALEGIKEKPVTGWGQEGYNYIFNKYYEPSLYAQEPWFDRAHNIFLDWAVAGGIPALLLFLTALLTVAWSLYRAPVSRAERVLLLSALFGYAVQGLAVFDNLFTYIPAHRHLQHGAHVLIATAEMDGAHGRSE
jgi:O-antigen ligase